MSIASDQRDALVRLRIENARQALTDARTLLDHGSLRGAANRIYYAMFYAVSSLALAKGVSCRTHVGLIGYFQKEFVKTGVVGREHGRALQKAFDDRSEADYEDLLQFDRGQMATRLGEAEGFIVAVVAHLRLTSEGQKSVEVEVTES